jgi:diaminopimelate epimerase
VEEECVVELLGGDLEIKWKGLGFSVLMTGSAVMVYEGMLTV